MTRAFITIDKKPLAATHFNGYPEGLGKKLLEANAKTPLQILEVAKPFTIDFVDSEYIEDLNKERLEEISERRGIPLAEVEERMKHFTVVSCKDLLIWDIEIYGDLCAYLYNFNSKTEKWEYAASIGLRVSEKFSDLKTYLMNLKKLKRE